MLYILVSFFLLLRIYLKNYLDLFPQSVFTLKSHRLGLWAPTDKMRIQRLAAQLKTKLIGQVSRCCFHFPGHGGSKAALRLIMRQLPHASWVARFDIKHYYQSMRHDILLNLLHTLGLPSEQRHLMAAFLQSGSTRGRGILAGNAIAPLLGTVMLMPLDRLMMAWRRQKKIVGYSRYMDDIVILASSRWGLRRAIKTFHSVLNTLDLQVYGDQKRMIGKVTTGFDFLGYQLQRGRKLRLSQQSVRRFQTRLTGLTSKGPQRIRSFVLHWQRAMTAGLTSLISLQGGESRAYKRACHYLQKKSSAIEG